MEPKGEKKIIKRIVGGREVNILNSVRPLLASEFHDYMTLRISNIENKTK